MSEIKIALSDLAKSQFASGSIGTKVIVDAERYIEAITPFVQKFDFNGEDVKEPGQGLITIDSQEAMEMVSCGTGKVEGHGPEDYVIREWRDEIGHFLKREFAGPCQDLKVVVYTREAYGNDPQVTPERLEAIGDEATHVLVITLASAGPVGMSSHRFVRNFAGGNAEYDVLNRLTDHMVELKKQDGTFHDSKQGYQAQTEFLKNEVKDLIKRAQDVVSYEQEWAVVAD